MVEIIEAASTGDYSFYKTHHAPEKIYLQLINSLISNSAADEEQKLWSRAGSCCSLHGSLNTNGDVIHSRGMPQSWAGNS